MAQKIRGITIELSADATGVLDAVKDINKQIKTTSSQLKDVDKLLKLDPTNTTLLTQKTQLLQTQISETKSKLDELKKAQADMDANGVDKNSEQYQALQREIIATEQELKKLENTAGSGSAALAKVSAVTGEWGEKMENAGKKLSVLSAGLVALGAAAIKSFDEVDEGMDTIIKKTGATGDEADELEEIYRNIAGSMVGDFGEIGAAIGETSTRFGLTGDDLEALAKQFLKFSDINDTDVVNSIDTVQKALGAFGLDATDAESLLDRLTSVSQHTGASVDTLSEGLIQNGTAFQEMGLNIDQATELMGQMETSGANSETVMQGLRKALKSAAEDGVPLNDALAELQNQILNGTDGMDGLTAAYDLFGKSGDQIYNAVKNGTLNFADLAVAVSDVSGAVDNTYEATLDGTDKMRLAWQNMQLGLADLGEAIGNTLAPVMDKITSAIQSVVEWFGNLDDGTKETIVTIGLIVAAIGPLLVVGGKVMKGISSITGALSKMGSASAGPIGLVIAGVAALVAGVVALSNSMAQAYKDASPFTDALEDTAKKNKDLANSIEDTRQAYESSVEATEASAFAAETLYGKLQDLIAGYDGSASSAAEIEAVIDELNSLVPGLGLSWDSVTNSLNLTNEEIYANIEAMRAQAQVAALQEMYTESLKEQYTAQKNYNEAVKTGADVISSYGLTMQDVTACIHDGKVNVDQLEAALYANGVAFLDVNDAADEVLTAFLNCLEASSNVEAATQNVTFAETELAAAMETASEATQTNKDTVIQAADDINEQVDFTEAKETAAAAGEEIPAEMAAGINANSDQVGTAAEDLAGEVTDGLSTLPADTEAAGSDSGEELNSGFSGWKGTVAQTVDDMYEFFNSTLGTTLPAMMSQWGSNSGQKFNSGMNLWSGDIQSTAQSIQSSIQNALNPLAGSLRNIGYQAGAGLYSGLGSWQAQLTSLANSIANSISSAARRALKIQSPSKVMREIGNRVGEGLELGILDSEPGIKKAMTGIANAVASVNTKDKIETIGSVIAQQQAQTSGPRTTGGSGGEIGSADLGRILSVLTQYLPHIEDDKEIIFDDGAWAGRLAPVINQKFNEYAIRSARG